MQTEARYIQIRSMDVANGEYIGCAVFFQGCPFHCKNCFNQETWDMDGGKAWTDETTQEVLHLVSGSHLKRITFLGGEPMIDRNLGLLESLVHSIKDIRPDIKIWVYSGFLYEDLITRKGREKEILNVLECVDTLVDGTFKEELKDFKLRFRGSANQRIIDVQESLKQGVVVCDERLMKLRD